MDRRDVVKWLRDNPDVDVTSLASEAKAEWSCTLDPDMAIGAAVMENSGSIGLLTSYCHRTLSHIFLKPDDAEAFARHILELVKK